MQKNKRKSKYSQTTYLFAVYGLFTLLLLISFFLIAYSYHRKNTLLEQEKDIENLCDSITYSIETELNNLSTSSLNIIYSNTIQKNFSKFTNLYNTDTSPENLVASWNEAHSVYDIITAMIGAFQASSQIKLYTMDGVCIEGGFSPRISEVTIEDLSWYQETMSLDGRKYITAPYVNKTLPAIGENQSAHKFISLTRTFFKFNNQPEGIIEVVQDCGKFFSLTSHLSTSNPDANIYVYNDRQELVYPFIGINRNHHYELINNYNISPEASKMVDRINEESLLVTYNIVEDYNWIVMVTKSETALYAPLKSFRSTFFVVIICSIFLTLCICFLISQRFTSPLRELTNVTGAITLNSVLDGVSVHIAAGNSSIKEIASLSHSIEHMHKRLRKTSQEVLLAHSEENKAKLQATQSLIKPHYLYNSLTTISIMAEENMNQEIVHMCQALCDYFRYISSSSQMTVSLEQEIFYSEQYMKCMKFRYDTRFTYTLEIDPLTKSILIPKLILQPFIENSFLYAFTRSNPLHIHIASILENENWKIIISDNGGNLSETKREELLTYYKNLDVQKELNDLKIGGMGLKNVYLRMKLLYGKQALFAIYSDSKQTTFTLGGPLYISKEDTNA